MNLERQAVDVSIVVLTYYHEKYIAQALDSILAQKTGLRLEVLVGDDASQDKTPEIVREYAARYPDLIFPVLRLENWGANKNYWDLLGQCRGRYIAVLEGDDLWLDPNKLQKQWAFLEAHPEYVAHGGKCLMINEDGRPDYTKAPHFVSNKKVFTIEDFIASWDMPAQASTMMFRNIYRDMAPDEYSILYQAHPIVGDKTELLLLLSQGSVYCCNEIMSCYRYVIKKGGHNWFSIHHDNQHWQYDGFLYPCRLEKWAKKNLKLKGHLGNRKDYHFCSFVEDLVRMPSWKRVRYLWEMIAQSRQPVKYFLYIFKALIEME